jgi:ABC-type nitrate/sulfonate/bicarbonate transport system substrate-binding protein
MANRVTRYSGVGCFVKLGVLTAILAIVTLVGGAESADRVRIGVSNYNLSNLTVGVAQTKDFFKQEGIDAEIIRMNPNVATMALVNGDVDYTTLIGSVIGSSHAEGGGSVSRNVESPEQSRASGNI